MNRILLSFSVVLSQSVASSAMGFRSGEIPDSLNDNLMDRRLKHRTS
jgi:hypothetical protein